MSEVYAAENLRKLREERGLSRQGLINAMEDFGLSLHSTTLRRIEDGSQPMKVNEAAAFAEFFEVSLDQFVSLPIDMKTAKAQIDYKRINERRHDFESGLSAYVFWLNEYGETYSKDRKWTDTTGEYGKAILEIVNQDLPVFQASTQLLKLFGVSPNGNDPREELG